VGVPQAAHQGFAVTGIGLDGRDDRQPRGPGSGEADGGGVRGRHLLPADVGTRHRIHALDVPEGGQAGGIGGDALALVARCDLADLPGDDGDAVELVGQESRTLAIVTDFVAGPNLRGYPAGATLPPAEAGGR